MSKIENQKKVALVTLGCKLNFSETSFIGKEFEKRGYLKVDSGKEADVIVINTCTVTENANRKCRQMISKIVRRSPGAFIAVVGCYSQLNADEISNFKGVDLVLGTNEKFKIFDYLENEFHTINNKNTRELENQFFHSFSSNERTRSFLKIQDGCDYFCSYCTIPFARGRSRNANIQEIIKTAREIASRGVNEIVLTGVNIGDFGKSSGENLFQLLKTLDKEVQVPRIRLSSIEPDLLTLDIIKLVKDSSKILPHFHLPLQSGSDQVLKLMNRKYETKLYKRIVEQIRSHLPLAGIGTDIICGFPGESSSIYRESEHFLESVDINFLHVFSYSERNGTKAEKMENKIPPREISSRSKKLQELGKMKKINFYNRNIGSIHDILVETTNEMGYLNGFTGNYIKTRIPFHKDIKGTIVKGKILTVNSNETVEIEII
ncbi:MAG: tRNA (N(6)-L-threonylcarbamoyladenosine(37)-C(2))-methylthiotransferase MtaB [bacterium]